MPHISAYITAYARVKLFNYLKMADTPVYCDTDSVYCRSLGENSKELGKMKIEHRFGRFRAYLPKVYEADDIKKAKGIPSHILKRIPSLSVLYEQPAEWESLASMRRSISAKSNVSFGGGLLKYVLMTRRLRQTYSKATLEDSGRLYAFLFYRGEILPHPRISLGMSHTAGTQACR